MAQYRFPSNGSYDSQRDIRYWLNLRCDESLSFLVPGIGLLEKLRSPFDTLMGRRDMDERDTTFKDAGFRKFEYSWTLIPKNEEDADQINKIAQSFQVLAYPSLSELSGGFKIIHPPIWNLEIWDAANGTGIYKWDMGPNICVLTNAKIKTASNGIYSTKNNYPAATEISLSFQELEPAVRISGGSVGQLVSRSQARGDGATRSNDLGS